MMWRALLPMLVLGVGCTHSVHLNHTSDFVLTKPLAEHRKIESTAEQKVIFGFSGQTEYANDAFRRLMNQCESGTVTGIQTRFSTSLNFFHWTNTVYMKGYCSN